MKRAASFLLVPAASLLAAISAHAPTTVAYDAGDRS